MHKDHKKYLKQTGVNIRCERSRHNLSLGTLSKLCNVSKGNLSKIENGTGNLTVVTLSKIGWALGCQPYHLLPRFESRFIT